MANGTFEDVMRILHSVPGVKEHDERFCNRANRRVRQFEEMAMNEKDAKNLGWLFTFHEFEDGLYSVSDFSKGEENHGEHE